MRRAIVIALCAVSFIIALPAPAHAWWLWLDELSGPGPFTGFDVQWRLACLNDKLPETAPNTPTGRQALAKRNEKQAQLDMASDSQKAFAEQELKAAQEALDIEVEKIRVSKDPGDFVLRSRESFAGESGEKTKKTLAAILLGAGCLKQSKGNAIGSLNLRVAYLWSIHNRLTYAEPEFANDGPQVKLFQPELSFTLFVDQRKSVELGSAIGLSFAYTHKENVDVLKRFYWRPFVLSVSPASLLRKNGQGETKGKGQKALRALTLTSSIVIMPQELNDTDFGAVAGTFHTSRDMQGLFGLTLDLSRF